VIGLRVFGQLLMTVDGQIQTAANTRPGRKIEQPGESGMLTGPCRSVLAESNRWISR
jgi:hypothetical protein